MKQRYGIIGSLFMTLLLLLTTQTAFASTYEGRLDGIHDNAIYGWAWDSLEQDSFVDVRVVVKKQATSDIVHDSTVTANKYREDLSDSGKGTGNHSFVVSVDWSKLEECAYIVEAYVGDHLLTNSLQYENGTLTPVSTMSNKGLVSLGTFKTTAYCPCYSCSEGWGRQTSTGALATANHTIAVDPRVIPYGSKVMINGVIYTAEDRGGGVKGKHIDIYFNTHGETRQHGTRNAEIFLVQ